MPDKNKQDQESSGEELESSRVTELEGLIAEKDEALAAGICAFLSLSKP